MMVSTRGRNALRIMLDLAQQEPGQYCSLSNVSCLQGMSVKYGGHCRRAQPAGLLESQRGKDGGYRLRYPPSAYTVGAILKAGRVPLPRWPAWNAARAAASRPTSA